VVHLGFEVRMEVVRSDGEEVSVQLTRAETEALEPHAGSIMWLSAAPTPRGRPQAV
jgi:hypothetical protein